VLVEQPRARALGLAPPLVRAAGEAPHVRLDRDGQRVCVA
jgi:hypothetical protein